MQTPPIENIPESSPPRPNRRGLVAAGVAFVVALAVIGVTVFVGDDSDGSSPAGATASTPSVAPTTVPQQPTAAPTTSVAPSTTTTNAPPTTTEPPPPPPYPAGPPFDVSTIAIIPAGEPGPLAQGADGAFYVGDWGESGRIYRVELDGTVEVWAESDLLVEASAAAFGPDGRLYVSGSGIDTDEAIVAVGDGGLVEVITEQVEAPTGVFFTPDGRFLALDAGTLGAVVEINGDGSVEVLAQASVLSEPTHMALDDDGNLYVVNLANGRLYLVEPSGELTFVERFEGAPVGLVYLDGALYVSDWGDGWIYRYSIEDGTVTYVAGNGFQGVGDGPGIEASLSSPDSMIVGPAGEIYFVQSGGEDGGIALRVMTPSE